MKLIFVGLFTLTALLSAQSQTFEQLTRKADSCYFESKFSEAKSFFRLAFNKYPDERKGYYNAACVASLSADHDLAFIWLNKAVDFGFKNLEQLKQEKDFIHLHSDKRWRKLVERLEKSNTNEDANYDKATQRELIDIFNSDQSIRYQFLAAKDKYGLGNKTVDSLLSVMHYQDSLNLVRVERVISEKGWLGAKKVGTQASHTLFLVIQHSNLETQKKYLPILKKAVAEGDALPGSLAFLEDRIAVFEGRKQIYGTQFFTEPKTNIKSLYPIENPENVDLRRSAVGLEPLQEYLKTWGIAK